MTLGQRIYQARTEAGLSQRQLAGEEITRNMLSALEHDGANPSVATLKYLSERLGKPVSYFLGEDTPQIPEFPMVGKARDAYDRKDFRECLDQLDRMETAGEILGREVSLLRVLSLLGLAEQSLWEGKMPYARTLLTRAEEAVQACPYADDTQVRRLRILQAHCPESESQLSTLVQRVPDDDEVLMLRAGAALTDNRFCDAQRYLNAAENRNAPEWNLQMGEVLFRQKKYKEAAPYFHRAEGEMPEKCVKRLEVCYREMEDYKMAYYYATYATK